MKFQKPFSNILKYNFLKSDKNLKTYIPVMCTFLLKVLYHRKVSLVSIPRTNTLTPTPFHCHPVTATTAHQVLAITTTTTTTTTLTMSVYGVNPC